MIHRAIRLTDWKQRDANRGVLRLHPRLARYKVTVLPLSKKDTLFLGHLSVDPGTPATASAANEGASRSAER